MKARAIANYEVVTRRGTVKFTVYYAQYPPSLRASEGWYWRAESDGSPCGGGPYPASALAFDAARELAPACAAQTPTA